MERDELQEYLNALGRSDCYRIDAVLKDSAIERTERVFFVGSNGSEFGPFIRKILKREAGQGIIYERIFRAQQAGKRFMHLPRIYECYPADESIIVIVEFIQGTTLQEYIEHNGPSLEAARRIFPVLCDAVIELHESFDPPIIHRDLTPANIIVSEGGVTLIDFGISRTFSPGAARDTTFLGTREFAPPEQYGFRQTDIRSDVFAMGKVLNYCIGGMPLAAHLGNPSEVDKEHLRHSINSATEFDPEMRFQSIGELKRSFLESFDLSAAQKQRAIRELQRSKTGQIARKTTEADLPRTDQAEAGWDATERTEVNLAIPRAVTLQSDDVLSSQVAAKIQEPTPESRIVNIPAPSSNMTALPVPRFAAGSTADAVYAAGPTVDTVHVARPTFLIKNWFRRIPRPLGIVWDLLILFVWAIMIAASISLVVVPEGEFATYPVWFRTLEVFGIATVPITAVFFFLLDLRSVRDRFPNARILSRRKTWYFLPAFIIVCWILVVIIGSAAGLLQPAS